VQHPGIESNGARIYLAIASRNESRESLKKGDEDASVEGEVTALRHIEKAFKFDKTSSISASILASHFTQQKQPQMVG